MRLGKFQFSPSRFLRRFAAAREGVVAITLALALLPMILLGGAAIDLRRISSSQSKLQAAADSAALAAVDALRQGDTSTASDRAITAGTNYANAAFDGDAVRPTVSIIPRSATTATARLWLRVPMTIMKMLSFNEKLIMADATATFGQPLELAIVLDTTESMGAGGRLDAAKTAAKNLVDTVMTLPDGTVNLNARVGLVPFAKYVNVGTQYNTATWLAAPSWLRSSLTYDDPRTGCTSCTTAWVFPPQKTCYREDVTPYDCTPPKYLQCVDCIGPKSIKQPIEWRGCVLSEQNKDEIDATTTVPPFIVDLSLSYDFRCPKPLIRLTRDVDGLKRAIDALTPEGETYSAPGLLWGWRIVSSNNPFSDGLSNGAVRKFVVFMTDGTNTNSPWVSNTYGLHEGTDVLFANDKLARVCTAMKNAGIMVFTVAFQVRDPALTNILSACASSQNYYYNASNNSALLQAFSTIGGQIGGIRLIR